MDDLLTELQQAHRESPSWRLYGLCHQAATRIAELEAKLAEAMKALVEIETQSRLVPVYSSQVTSGQILSSKISMIRDIASRAALRALEGGKVDG